MIDKQENAEFNRIVGNNIRKALWALDDEKRPGYSNSVRNHSLEWLALEVGVNACYISDLCNGKKGARAHTLYKIEEVLGVPHGSLYPHG